jgi:hypothetical protein
LFTNTNLFNIIHSFFLSEARECEKEKEKEKIIDTGEIARVRVRVGVVRRVAEGEGVRVRM